MDKKLRAVNAFIAGAIVVAVFVGGITIAGELYAPLKNLLKEAHDHHWVGKGIWSAIVFAAVSILYYIASKETNTDSTIRLMKMLSWMVILVTMALFGFFMYEFIIHV